MVYCTYFPLFMQNQIEKYNKERTFIVSFEFALISFCIHESGNFSVRHIKIWVDK